MLDPQSVSLARQLVVRSFDSAEANRIINDPSVFPTVTVPGVDHLDVSDVVANPNNVLMLAEGGTIVFACDIEGGIYEVHTCFLKESRGSHAIDASLEAYRWMFTHTPCMKIITKVPAFNRAARLAARAVGFVPAFMRKGAWPTADGNVDLYFYEMTYETWLRRQAESLMESGRAFHHHLEAEMERHGKPDKQHPDDDAHDLYVGACVETVYGGQPDKGIVIYNRWARFSGYQPIALVARSPLVIDIGNAVLLVEDHNFKVIKCRSEA